MSATDPGQPRKRRHMAQAGEQVHSWLAEKVKETVVSQYEALPKTGKPQPHEHTVLCGFVLSSRSSSSTATERDGSGLPSSSDMRCVAIGTGTKCLGGSQRSEAGDLVNDSHAVGKPSVFVSSCLRTAGIHSPYSCLHCTAQVGRRAGS
mmetsp:Transcript_35373/g.100151  ORF Transcript_35373/g.100151 Transcript_35373/m.100151 type:complete len:149 (-) Transcript_35373:1851-2297(-)